MMNNTMDTVKKLWCIGLIAVLCIFGAGTHDLAAQNMVKRQKCTVCGQLLAKCKGQHPKPNSKPASTPKTKAQQKTDKKTSQTPKPKTQPSAPKPAPKPTCAVCRKAVDKCEFGGNHPVCQTCGELLENCKYNGQHIVCETCGEYQENCKYSGSHPVCEICGELEEKCEFAGSHPVCSTCGLLQEKCEFSGDHSEYNVTKLKAEQGDAVAQNLLGDYYYEGNNVAQDFQEAAKWYLKAAEQGNLDAQNSLQLKYKNGKAKPYIAKSNEDKKVYVTDTAPETNSEKEDPIASVKRRKKGYFGLRLSAGLFIPSVNFSSDSFYKLLGYHYNGHENKIGFTLDIGAIYNLPLIANLTLETGFELYHGRSEIDYFLYVPQYGWSRSDYITRIQTGFRIPIMLGYHFDFKKSNSLNLFTGPVLNVVISENFGNGDSWLCMGNKIEEDEQQVSGLWRIGGGFTFKNKFYIGISGDIGFTELIKGELKDYVRLKQNAFHFTLGYNF